MVTGARGGAIAAATAARDRDLEKEEEKMTPYTPEELNDDWEFKIVRSAFEAFRKPETLQRVIEEEARAGWVLLEKFDNGRLRFKRPISAREDDHLLRPDIDPYRVTVNASEIPVSVMIGSLLFLLIVGILLAVVMLG